MKFSFRSHVFHSNIKKLKQDSKPEDKGLHQVNQSKATLTNKTGASFKLNRQKNLEAYKEEESICSQLYFQHLLNRMEPRDQRIVIPYAYEFDLVENKRRVDEWLGQMSFSVASAAFNMFSSKQLSYEETKVYFSQNLLLNILLFMENVKDHQVYETMRYFNDRLKDNLEYLKKKYPQAKQIKANKKLREAVKAVNNMSNDDNDMLQKIGFQLNQTDKTDKKRVGLQNVSSKKQLQKMQQVPKQQSRRRMMSTSKATPSTTKRNENQVRIQQTIKQEDEEEQDEAQAAGSEQTPKQIRFVKNDDEDYTPQIMKLINYLISLPSEKCGKKQEKGTYFSKFFDMMQKIFDSAFFPSSYISQDEIFQQVIKNTGQSLEQLISKRKKNAENMSQNLKEYQEKVKKYTSYKISQKINPNTQAYTQDQISFGAFEVKSTAVLRVITKWIEQLQAKIKKAKEETLSRSFCFKTNHPSKSQQIKLSQNEKYDLYQSSLKQQDVVKAEEKKMIGQCYDIQGILAKIGTQIDDQNANIPKNQFCVAKFCTQLSSAASVYLLNYLNKIIHSLLEIPEQAGDEESQARKVNLITFKISDLIRCKCSSKQSQILRILNIIKKLDERKKQFFKIIRIKDRLDLGTKDILINVFFYEKIICEIQLEINDTEVQEKQKMYDSFNHYLYELSRSVLGPIMESACIWTHLDQRAKSIITSVKKSNVGRTKQLKHECQKQEMRPYKFSFVCSNCKIFYTNPIGVIKNKKCNSCNYYKCSLCKQKQVGAEQLKKQLELTKIEPFLSQFEEWNDKKEYLPAFAIFIPKKSKKIQYIFAQKVQFLQKIYYIRTVQNQEQCVQILIIKQLKGEDKMDRIQISQSYFVFQWKQRRLINQIIQSPISKQLELQKQERKNLKVQRRKKENEAKLADLKKERQNRTIASLKSGSAEQSSRQQFSQSISTLKMVTPIIGISQSRSPDIQQTSYMDVQVLQHQLGEDEKQRIIDVRRESDESAGIIYNETLAKLTYNNDLRICKKEVSEKTHYLILNYVPSQDNLKIMLKNIINKTAIFDLLESKKQVLMLQKERIDEDMIHQVLSSQSLDNIFSNVTYMYLDENRIVNLDFLKFFQNVEVLHANSNQIVKMNEIKQLKNIKQIMLNNNMITQISGIQGKRKLVTLCLDSNKIQEIANLRGLIKLEKLSLRKNEIYHVVEPERLKILTNLIYCDLSYNNLEEIIDLKKSSKLEHFDLCANRITEIKNLQQFKNLKILNLSYNQITQLASLNANTKLESLSLQCNRIKQIKNIEHMRTLRNLNLSSNTIKKIQNIQTLTKVTNLNLSYNKIGRLENIKELVNLQSLNLALNGFRNIELNQFQDQLKNMKNLKSFNLINNPINMKDPKNMQNLKSFLSDPRMAKITICKLP